VHLEDYVGVKFRIEIVQENVTTAISTTILTLTGLEACGIEIQTTHLWCPETSTVTTLPLPSTMAFPTSYPTPMAPSKCSATPLSPSETVTECKTTSHLGVGGVSGIAIGSFFSGAFLAGAFYYFHNKRNQQGKGSETVSNMRVCQKARKRSQL
jgi:hypothetical protein